MAPFVRVDVWSLKPDDPIITSYAKAVAAMQAKPASDKTSWAYQAAIHGSHQSPPKPLWNQCRHGGWFFLSWHRAYLYYFERIVRAEVVKAGGPKGWALPYWNYGGGATDNTLPVPFRARTLADGSANPLFVPGRSLTGSAGLPPSVTSAAFALSRANFTGISELGGGQTSAQGQFFSGTGRLEQTPHNDVHNMVGGLMLDPDTAAQDPIFWLHHANIDRVWWQWEQAQTHKDPTDPKWTTPSFSFFDVGGASVSKTGADVEHTETQLDYTYDTAPKAPKAPVTSRRHRTMAKWPSPFPEAPETPARPGTDPGPRRMMMGATARPLRLVGDTETVPVAIDARAAEGARAALAPADREQRAFLDVEDVDADTNPGTVYGVYVNLPDDPSADDLAAHHVGNVSLFGVERAKNPRGDEHAHSLRYSMEITDVLDQMADDGSWTDGQQLDVTFRPVTLQAPADPDGDPEHDDARVRRMAGPAHADSPITIGRVSVHYV
jgi:tyrosinase